MIRTPNAHSAKPRLEQLEGRDLPSFLLSTFSAEVNHQTNPAPFGNTPLQQLFTPLNNIVADMNATAADLRSVQATLAFHISQPIGGNMTGAGRAAFATIAQNYAQASADYQRILVDQHVIATLSAADQSFIGQAAAAEAGSGDTLDQLILQFGPLFGVNINAQFTTPVNTSNSIVQGLSSIVNQTYTNVGAGGQVFFLPSIASQTNSVPFQF
jgi:hypothetical protein